jgi:hypothetical protein
MRSGFPGLTVNGRALTKPSSARFGATPVCRTWNSPVLPRCCVPATTAEGLNRTPSIIEAEVSKRDQRCRAERAASVSDRSFASIRALTVAASKELPCPGRGKVVPLHYLQRYAAENARQDEPLPLLTSLWNFGLVDLGG